MPENQPSETTVKAALFTVLAVGFATLYAAVVVDPAPPRQCNPGTIPGVFMPCDPRVLK